MAKRAAAKAKSKKTVKKSAAAGAKGAKPAKGPKGQMGPKPIDFYYWPTPNGFKISIMLEECKLPYNLMPVNIAKGEQFKPEFLKISPNNRMPAIVDPNGPGGRPISIFESGAILQYLGRKTGKFYPKDERGRVEVDEWLFWQMAGLGPMAGHLPEQPLVDLDPAALVLGVELAGLTAQVLQDGAGFEDRDRFAARSVRIDDG